MNDTLKKINEKVEAQSEFVNLLFEEVGKMLVGQRYILERMLIAVLSGGHLLLEGVPGLAKTLSIRTLSDVIDTQFRRIQFTPDLLPADLIGTLIYDQTKKVFTPRKGPIFANLILADEINRAPAKVQSALLESMQERQVTLGDTTYPLEEPFMVMATQNPIEQEGTYPLPEAQIDRFLMKLKVTYPSKEEERVILERMTAPQLPCVEKVISPQQIVAAKEVVNSVYVDEKIKEYVLDIVFSTREPEKYHLKDLRPLIAFGASPRASICLIQCAKAHAFIKRRGFVTPEDIKAIGRDVLRHRVIPSFEAEAEEIDSEKIIDRIFTEIEVP